MRITPKQIIICKTTIHIISFSIIIYFASLTLNQGFGADPVKGMEHFTGKTALNMLMITLLVSPIAKAFNQGSLMRLRRMLGLYSFYWGTLHFIIYLGLDLYFDFTLLGEEIISRTYLSIGAVSWIVLLILSITSFRRAQQKLGKHWQTLHYWVYLVLILAPIHYYWSVKSNTIEPCIYISISIILLIFRRKVVKKLLPYSKYS